MRWTLGLVAFFAAVLGMNGVLIYAAVTGQEPVADSYAGEHR